MFDLYIHRYSSYTLEALQLAKFMIRSLLGQKLPAKAQDQVMKAVTPTDILNILRKYDGTNPNGGNKSCVCLYFVFLQETSLEKYTWLISSFFIRIIFISQEY